jgi:DNA-directed RNA polymerase subunit beta'
MDNVIVGRLIPAGTGLAYHAERRLAQTPEPLFESDFGAEASPEAKADN